METQLTKLYDLPKGSKIYCKCSDDSTYVTFGHVDGLYSYCLTEKGNVIHLSAIRSLEKIGDGYFLT